MIEAIKEIGEVILKNVTNVVPTKILDSLTLDDLSPEVEGKRQHLVIINYDIFKKKIEIDFEEIKEDTSLKYLWG